MLTVRAPDGVLILSRIERQTRQRFSLQVIHHHVDVRGIVQLHRDIPSIRRDSGHFVGPRWQSQRFFLSLSIDPHQGAFKARPGGTRHIDECPCVGDIKIHHTLPLGQHPLLNADGVAHRLQTIEIEPDRPQRPLRPVEQVPRRGIAGRGPATEYDLVFTCVERQDGNLRFEAVASRPDGEQHMLASR